MKTKKTAPRNAYADFEQAVQEPGQEQYILRLYVAGTTPRSVRAIENIKQICEQHLKGRYDLEVIDIYQQPILSQGEQIIAAPTLVKKLPEPLRTFIGDMSNTEKILVGLDLRSKAAKRGSRKKKADAQQ